ncbi:MAG: hypothetical protein V7638_1632 [Acidobacteriota bacterium]|jgi:hypothetical protein
MAIVLSQSPDVEDGPLIPIEVEVEPSTGYNYEDVRFGESALVKVGDLYGKALDLANECANEVHRRIVKMTEAVRPNEYSVKFGIKMDAEIGALVTKSQAGAQLEITLKWISPARESQSNEIVKSK